MSTWASRCSRARQGYFLVGGRLWWSLLASLSLYLCHNWLWGDWRLWFSHWTPIIAGWSCLLHTVSACSSSHLWLRLRFVLRLRLWFRLLCYSSIRHRAAFNGGRAILVCYRLPRAWLAIGCRQVYKNLRLLVSTFGSSFDSGRFLEREIGAVGMRFGAARPSL